VLASRKSNAIYMMAENYTYLKPNVLVRELARQGLFGVVYYAEGEYLHELKQLNETTPWRRQWQTGVDGVTYGTHSLGPILQWMPGDRVVRLSCEGSGHHYRDPRGDPYHDDTAVMLCKTARGVLIKIRVDMLSDRPHAMANYQLQGTDGCYESGRGGPGDRGKLWLRALSSEMRWHDVDALLADPAFAEKHLPEIWRHPPPEAVRAGHGGGDFFEVRDFLDAVRGNAPCPIGIHEAMDMTLPGLISQQSIAHGGGWLDVPDSRSWTENPPYRQLHMVWPVGAGPCARPGSEAGQAQGPAPTAPVPHVPHGYEMRQYREADEAEYLALMAKAGFKTWDHEQMARTLRSVLPGGFFLIVHAATGKIVATAMAQHKPTDLHPFGGEMGWVAADPDHKARGLGRAVTAAATARLTQAGYRSIYLLTDDFRLPAIAIYLRLGFEPFLYADGMAERWKAVRGKIRHP
jgi:predicted dehydrogenase/ribosomal protein S18 acetylase RimI-like enzyme